MQDRIHAWLNARGISDDTIMAFNLSETTHYALGEHAIVLPVNNPDGTFSFNKYRRDPLQGAVTPKYMYDKGSRTQLFGADKLAGVLKGNLVVITEGELDALVLHSMGIVAVSSTGGALSFQEEWAEDLKRYPTYICYDNDEAGAKGAVRTLQHIPSARVVMIPEQPDVKDISDFVSRGGDFHNLLRSARGFTSVEEVKEDMAQRKAQWLPTRFHKAYLDVHDNPAPTAPTSTYVSPEGDARKAKAKEYPCTEITPFIKRKAQCPKHNEKTPSLHYYPKTNSCYCFGCSESFDSIELYRAVNNCTFKEALDALNK